MATIGSFKKVGNDFHGEIITLSLQAKGVRIVAETNRASENAPSHRIYVGRAEIGAGWSKRLASWSACGGAIGTLAQAPSTKSSDRDRLLPRITESSRH